MSNGANFMSARWASVSDAAKAVVEALLNVDPASRPTAAEALTYAWLQPHVPGNVNPSSSGDGTAAATGPPDDEDDVNIAFL